MERRAKPGAFMENFKNTELEIRSAAVKVRHNVVGIKFYDQCDHAGTRFKTGSRFSLAKKQNVPITLLAGLLANRGLALICPDFPALSIACRHIRRTKYFQNLRLGGHTRANVHLHIPLRQGAVAGRKRLGRYDIDTTRQASRQSDQKCFPNHFQEITNGVKMMGRKSTIKIKLYNRNRPLLLRISSRPNRKTFTGLLPAFRSRYSKMSFGAVRLHRSFELPVRLPL